MQSRKMTPPQADNNAAMTMLLAGVLIGVIMIVVGIVAAGRDDLQPDPTPTLIPAPSLSGGGSLTIDTIVYTNQPLGFSFIAAADNENIGQTLEACTPVQLKNDATLGDFFYLDSTVNPPIYWLHGTVTDDRGWNGWLPLSALSDVKPADCP